MARKVPFAKVGKFSEAPKEASLKGGGPVAASPANRQAVELALLESNIERKLRADDAAEYGPLTITQPHTATYTANPWEIVECNPTTGGFGIVLPNPSGALVKGAWVWVKNATASANSITVTALGALIDGAASFSVTGARSCQAFFAQGDEWQSGNPTSTAGVPTETNGYIQRWSWTGAVGSATTATWTVPAAGNRFRVTLVGAGGGGAGGAMRLSNSSTGGGGGGGGAYFERWLSRAEVLALQTAGGGSIAVTAGGSGAGGAGATASATNGISGGAATGPSLFGSLTAYPGGLGFQGNLTNLSGGGGGGGSIGTGGAGALNAITPGGQPIDNSPSPFNNAGYGGGSSIPGSGGVFYGGCSMWGGGAGGTGHPDPRVSADGGRSYYGGGGGGSGSGEDGVNGPGVVAGAGGASGVLNDTTHGGGGAGGAVSSVGNAGSGTNGTAGTDTHAGSGGGGGGVSRTAGTANSGDGGVGGTPGGGGGGGGSRYANAGSFGVGSRAGNGADGGPGQVVIESYF